MVVTATGLTSVREIVSGANELNARTNLPHHLTIAERDADRFFQREVPHLIIFRVLERQRRLAQFTSASDGSLTSGYSISVATSM